MKTKNIILTISAIAFAALAGCGQQSGVNSPSDSTNSTTGQTMSPTTTVSDTNMLSTNSMGTNSSPMGTNAP